MAGSKTSTAPPHPGSRVAPEPTREPAWTDPIIEIYKRDLDRASIRENLRRSPEERVRNLQALQSFAAELRRAGRAIG